MTFELRWKKRGNVVTKFLKIKLELECWWLKKKRIQFYDAEDFDKINDSQQMQE